MPALLETVRGQAAPVAALRRALALGRAHHAYLFDGPEGVGKERTAFGFAQALVCERRTQGQADACGECSACTRAIPRPGESRPLHPDVIVLERGLYDAAAIGRRTPELQDISIDQVRTLVLSRAAYPPYEGRARVFLVRRAEELGPAAANALLKTLEEPGARVHFVLLTAAPDRLLPTIRSRAQRVRFAPLPDDVLVQLLVERGVEKEAARAIVPLAAGSIAAALGLSDAESMARRNEFVSRAMKALETRDLGLALEVGEDAKKLEKAALVEHLAALASAFAHQARSAISAPDRRASVAAARYGLASEALQQIEANASVQLAVEAMFLKMRAV